ncbi:MAG: DUF4157 domain-containing protein [Dehalococcoidia bacterium]
MAEHERVNKTEADERIPKSKLQESSDKLHSKERAANGSEGINPGFIHDIDSLRSADPVQRARIIHDLQHTHGNAYVQRLFNSSDVQAKLSVSSPEDEYEQEADAVGEALARATEEQVQRQVDPGEEEEEEVQTKIQRQEEDGLMMSTVDPVAREVSDDIESRIDAARGSGQSMTEAVRDTIEPQMGYDFSGVRLHADSEANQLSEQLDARAFTVGSDIFFRTGEYQPETTEGRKLLGHELTHVVQQGSASVYRQPLETVEDGSSASQMEAWEALEEARKNAWITPTRENIRVLLSHAASCLGAGMEGDVRSALDSVAGRAVEMVKGESGMLDLPASSLNVANDIIDKLREMRSIDEGNTESAGQTVGEMLGGWAVGQMTSTAALLGEGASEEVASRVVEKTALVLMLGRDYSPGIEAIQKWAVEKSRINEESAEED